MKTTAVSVLGVCAFPSNFGGFKPFVEYYSDEVGFMFVRLTKETWCDVIFVEEAETDNELDEVLSKFKKIETSRRRTVHYETCFIPVSTFEEALLLLDCGVWKAAGAIDFWRYKRQEVKQFVPIDGDRFGIKTSRLDLEECTFNWGCSTPEIDVFHGDNPVCSK